MTDLAATTENLPFQLDFAIDLTEAENRRQRLLVLKKRYLLETQNPALSFSHLLLAINSLRKPLKAQKKDNAQIQAARTGGTEKLCKKTLQYIRF